MKQEEAKTEQGQDQFDTRHIQAAQDEMSLLRTEQDTAFSELQAKSQQVIRLQQENALAGQKEAELEGEIARLKEDALAAKAREEKLLVEQQAKSQEVAELEAARRSLQQENGLAGQRE